MHQHKWNIIDKKQDCIERSRSSESESYIKSRCECGAIKHEAIKTMIQEVEVGK